ncbi:MAG: hypothetical protein C4519_20425 [Desulfobacteraceae bacterium]|nr:MAG: hypothetical protein C4519_20425 [Desulfobacteraceae bacterium]
MLRFIQVVFAATVLVMVVFAVTVDSSGAGNHFEILDLATYMRIASILGLLIAAFMAWGYKKKIEASQRFLRARQVLAEAEATAERKQRAVEQLEGTLKAQFAEKEMVLKEEIEKIKSDYAERLAALKEQNMRLKETVSKLMQAVKNKG